MSSNINMSSKKKVATTIKIKGEKKKIPIFVGKSKQINKKIQLAINENPNNVTIPKGYAIDLQRKTLIPIRTAVSKQFSKRFKDIIKSNPQQLKMNKLETVDITDKNKPKILSRLVAEGIGTGYLRNDKSGYILKKKDIKYEQLFSDKQEKVYRGKKLASNSGVTVSNIYNLDAEDLENYSTSLDDAIDQFKSIIEATALQDFKSQMNNPAVSIRRVLLRFGDNDYRFFDLDEIQNLNFMIENFNSNNSWGSDKVSGFINGENLDFTWFQLSFTGLGNISGGGDAKVASKYWYCKQPVTKNNQCLEGAIKKGLGLKIQVPTLRKRMSKYNILEKQMVSFDKIPLYEQEFEVCLDIYEDSSHFDNDNLIRSSPCSYEQRLKILYKDEHYALIDKPKLKIRELSTAQKRKFGLSKKTEVKVPYVPKKEKSKLKTLLLVFDIETVFDRYDNQFLKPYGVSWVVWDLNNKFNYNEDIHLNEPTCYYKRGKNCLKELIKFMVNPPKGCKYRPLGFNNSRFDNFALCETAKQMGVLKNVFMADGSILYASISNCANTWDACRFLTGSSLDSACKNYKTNPKKEKDLIDHYEIQTYFEKFGWEGLCKLLDTNNDLVKYNKLDCLCLLDLTIKMRSAYLALFNEDVFDYLTISSMGYKICAKRWKGEDYMEQIAEAKTIKDATQRQEFLSSVVPKFSITKPKCYEDDLFFRQSLTAGRTQAFYGKLDYQGEVAMGDIKSLYPTVMGNYGGNHCPFPYGDYRKVDCEEKGKLGIYRVDIIHQKAIWKNQDKVYKQFELVKQLTGIDLYRQYAPNIIAKREVDKPLNWDWKGEIKNIKLTSVDIDVIRWATEDEDCVKIYEGYVWDEARTDLFNDFLDPPRLEKTKQDHLKEANDPNYNCAIREGCKGISNALSGKLLEALHDDICELFSMKSYTKMCEENTHLKLDIQDFGGGLSFITGKKPKDEVFEKMREDNIKPSYLGMFVYSYARKLMYQKILGKYITLYMDTDSAAMPRCEWERLCEDYEGKDWVKKCSETRVTNNFVNTGEYGCIEEEVCKNGCYADRLISISPKNYCVINSNYEEKSKRKFKGIRKTDYWVNIDYFGETLDEAKKHIRGCRREGIMPFSQDSIRRLREHKCCVKCIGDVLSGGCKCEECKAYEEITKKAYTTEMFEALVNGEKIAVLCSMINRITYNVGQHTEWDFSRQTKYSPSAEELVDILHSNEGKEDNPVQLTYNPETEEVETVRTLNSVFKLKQRYMIKII